MSDWCENLKRYALSDDMDYRLTFEDAAIALDRIEELEAEIKEWDKNFSNHQAEWWNKEDVLEKRIEELEAEIERLRAVAEWFVGIGLDYIPNEVYHERGGYSLVVKSGVLGESE